MDLLRFGDNLNNFKKGDKINYLSKVFVITDVCDDLVYAKWHVSGDTRKIKNFLLAKKLIKNLKGINVILPEHLPVAKYKPGSQVTLNKVNYLDHFKDKILTVTASIAIPHWMLSSHTTMYLFQEEGFDRWIYESELRSVKQFNKIWRSLG